MNEMPLIIKIALIIQIIMIIHTIVDDIKSEIKWRKEHGSPKQFKEDMRKSKEELDRLIREHNQNIRWHKDIPAIEIILYEDLKKFCKKQRIPLYYGEEYFEKNKEAVGLVKYTVFHDYVSPIVFNYEIYIRTEDDFDIDRNNVWILAHELGHFISISQHRDTTEEGADYEARKLCCSMLTEDDLVNSYLQITLNCRTIEEELMKKFEHIKNLT